MMVVAIDVAVVGTVVVVVDAVVVCFAILAVASVIGLLFCSKTV